MSALGHASDMQGGISGEGIRWPHKKILGRTQNKELNRKAKFTNLIQTKNHISAATGETQGNYTEAVQAGGRRQRQQGRQKRQQGGNARYKLVYARGSTTQKKKPTREASGEIPTFTTQGGHTSTLFGHTVQQIDNRNIFRALFQNPNGINPHPGNHLFAMNLAECYDNCIALVGLSETNREWSKPALQNQLREATHKIWRSSVIQTSTSSERFEDNYKPGGTALILCEDHWTCRLLEKGEDPWGLGRWSYVLLAGKKSRRVLWVNGYRVCLASVSSVGEKTAYKQQYNILRGRMQGTIDPRRQGVLDMQTWLGFFIAQGVEVIFYLDGNENLSGKIGKWCETPPYQQGKHATAADHDGSLATLVTTLGLVDILAEQHKVDIPATYSRGQRRLDYVFATPAVMESVERSCLLPFHTMFGGDHRPVLIDFNARVLFGDDSYEIQKQKSRGLTLQDPRVVDKYIETLQKQLMYHKIYDKYEELQGLSQEGVWNEACVNQYEKMDVIITESTKYADRTVAKRFSTTYEWSPALMRSVEIARYWELRLKRAKGIPVDEGTLQKHREAAKLPLVISDHIIERSAIIDSLREARRAMYDNQKRHVELRRTHLEEIAEATLLQRRPWLAEEGYEQPRQEQTEKQLKELIKREQLRKMHRAIGFLLKPGRGKGLLQVDIPDASAAPPPGETYGDPEDPKTWRGPWLSIKEPEAMAASIAKANIKSYHQAHTTPFAGDKLGRSLGNYAETPIADKILSGETLPEYLTDHLMDETRRMLHVLGTKPALVVHKPIKTAITAEEFKALYKAIHEKISSSPSDKHVGHYKAATKSDSLSRLYAGMMSLPWTEGFSPRRWQVVLDVMLPKEANNWRISRLRIIQLYESDANQSMRMMFARQLGHILEDSNLVPEMQFGSRPGKMCISPVLQKVLTYDIARLAKLVIGCEENDAIGCYDRIANPLGYIQCRRLGMPMSAIKALAATWANMVHVIRTAYGRSSSAYRSTPRLPLYGAGQGSTNGPFFWLLMFILMYDSLDPELRTLVFFCAWASFHASRTGDAFVDDSHIGVTSSHIDVPELTLGDNTCLHELQVIADLTKLAQHYERLLWSTGGALNVLKCSWVLISWVWNKGRAKLATIEQAPGSIKLTAGVAATPQEVPRLQPTATYRTLGVYISGNGKQDKARELLRGHAATYAGKIGPAIITPVTAFYAFQLYLGPKLGFPLPVSSFTFKECSYIQAPALMATLPKLKINRNTARAIVHGPNYYGGLQLQHIYCEQANGQLRLLLGHLRNRDHTGELIIIAISYMQILVGSTKPFWNLPYSKYAKWIENCWLKSIWEFVYRAGFSIEVRQAWTPEMPRENDSTLMTIFIESGYGNFELAQLNRCRLFLQVFFISDIASANGREIDDGYRTSTGNVSRRSTWKWPQQGMPDSQAWRLWGRALAHLEDYGKLRVPLGTWLTVGHQVWEWQIHLQTKIVRRITEGNTVYYHPMISGGTRRSANFYSVGTGDFIHPELREATGWAAVTPQFSEVGDGIFSVQVSGELASGGEPMGLSEGLEGSFQDKLRQAHPFYLRLAGPLPSLTEGTLEAIRSYIMEGSLLTCSDGSHEPEDGSASQAWLFSDKDGHVLWGGSGPIDGHPDMLSSYRSELGGITTVLFLLLQVVDFFDIKSGGVMLYCDNEGALENVFDEFPKRGIYPLLARDYDLLGTARALLKRIPVKVTGCWVKGHYKGDQREVSHNLNDIADQLAEQFRLSPPAGYTPRRMPSLHPDYEALLYFSGATVTTKFKNIIYRQVFSPDLEANIMRRTGWTPQQFRRISWEAYDAAFRGQTTFRQIAIAKLSHDLWNTGEQKKRFGQDELGICPVCNDEFETMDHIFQCRAESAIQMKRHSLIQLEDHMNRIGTPLAIRRSIMAGLEWWLQLTQQEYCPRAPGFGSISGADVWSTNAYAEQTGLGWGQLLRGRVSTLWGDAFVKESRSSKPKEAHGKWTKQMIKLFWQLALDIWDHRNAELHGRTLEEQQEKQQREITTKVTEYYRNFGINPSCRAQDSAVPTTITRATLPEVDIAFPERYSLRRRRRGDTCTGPLDDSDEYIIPPAMFAEYSDSSYSLSGQRDVLYRADSPMAIHEVPQLILDLALSLSGSSFLLTDSDSSYSDSEQQDVLLRPDFSVSTAEMESLAERGAISSHGQGTNGSFSLSSRELALLNQVEERTEAARHHLFELGSSALSSIPERQEHLQSIDVSPVSHSSSVLTGHIPFPLHAIGALYAPTTSGDSWESIPMEGAVDVAHNSAFPALQVLGEFRDGSNSAPLFPLRQPSFSGSESSSVMTYQRQEEPNALDALTTHRLVGRAQQWLMSYRGEPRWPQLSPSIYWAVRSLGTYFAAELAMAEAGGAAPLPMIRETEWPIAPTGGDNYDWSAVPEWLRALLTVDNLHDWGLRGVRQRSAVRRDGTLSLGVSLRNMFFGDIAFREMDDPPDREAYQSTASSTDQGIIEELTDSGSANSQVGASSSASYMGMGRRDVPIRLIPLQELDDPPDRSAQQELASSTDVEVTMELNNTGTIINMGREEHPCNKT